ncbi:MAG: hypothetical protein QOH85_1779 [Acidobacteriaceae bacterium]|jgi:hypothetical protein|nr:hypothetical protein [Acidobacteriaceae bacterium]
MPQRPTALVLLRLGVLGTVLTIVAAAVPSASLHAQTAIASATLPDAPLPQTSSSQTSSSQAPATQTAPLSPAQNQAPSTSRPLVPPAPATKEQQRTADEDLKKAEKQRILGVMPMFQMVNGSDHVLPLRPKQKFQLMWKSSTDPFIFSLDALVALVGQADDSNSGTKIVTNPDGTKRVARWGFPQGVNGYFQRFGTSYADTLDGNFWGNAVLPALLKEDPRYFRMGTGSFTRRFLYSASTTVWCRRDNGKWGPNYANVAGNFISGGISNLYYPSEEGGFEKTTIGALTVTAEGTFGAELIEFWPDIAHHFRKKHQPQP